MKSPDTLDRYGEGRTAPIRGPRSDSIFDTRQPDPAVVPALGGTRRGIQARCEQYGSLRLLPAAAVPNVRNDMYLASEAIRHLTLDRTLTFARHDAELC